MRIKLAVLAYGLSFAAMPPAAAQVVSGVICVNGAEMG